MSNHRVLSVGQCMADHAGISRLLREAGTEVVAAGSALEALERLRREVFALVLVNRVFDETGEGGLDFIRRLKADRELHEVPVMLVSNFPEAQEEAVAAGAIPGFGKSALHDPATVERLRVCLA